jgi:hypothetical protein
MITYEEVRNYHFEAAHIYMDVSYSDVVEADQKSLISNYNTYDVDGRPVHVLSTYAAIPMLADKEFLSGMTYGDVVTPIEPSAID